MDKLAALKAFIAVTEESGFAAAARRLGQSRSSVNRLVINLEESLGVQLLNRTTRRVALTASGRAFYERVEALLADLDEAERSLGEAQDEPVGPMRINAPMSFGTLHLSPLIAEFMARYPAVQIELRLNDRFVDVVEEGYDLTIRIAEPDEESQLVDHRIAPVRRVLCAAPDYLACRGAPGAPAALADHDCLHYGYLPTGTRRRLVGPDGPHAVAVKGMLCSNNGEVLRDAAVRGLDIALLPTFIAGGELQAGRLVTVLAGYPPVSLTLCAIYPPSRHLSAKVRLFTDLLVERFGDRPYWDLVE
jgi:DNA-binding transcriptional LysR family regulator